MLLLLIIADDFTGALDTGVQFAAYGAATRVMVKDQVDFASCDAQVLKGQPEAVQNMQGFLREIHPRSKPRSLPTLGSQQDEQKIREIGENDFLDVYRLFHSSSPLSLCLTAGLMMSFAA